MYLSAKGASSARGNQCFGKPVPACPLPALGSEAVQQLPTQQSHLGLGTLSLVLQVWALTDPFWASARSPNLVCLWLERSWSELVVAVLPAHVKQFFLDALAVKTHGVD